MLSQYISEGKKTFLLGVPFIANQLMQMSVVTIDSIMAGWHSDLTLAAVAQGSSLWMLVQLVVIGLSMVAAPMIAKSFSKGDHKQLRDVFQQSVWLAILLGGLGVLLTLIAPLLLHVVGVDKQIIPLATDYLWIMALAMPFFTLYLPIRFFNEGTANPKIIMMITALSVPINVVGNYVLINGLWIFPEMGIRGIAVASVLSMGVIFALGCWYITRSARVKPFALFDNFAPLDRVFIRQILRLGTPNAIALLSEVGMFTCVVLLTGRMGVTTAAANQVALSYISTTFMLPLGLSFAITTRVGMASAENNPEKLRQIGISGMVLGAMFMLGSVCVIALFGSQIAHLYSDNENVVQMALGLLALAVIFQIPDGIQVCAAGALRALEETKAPMQYALLGYWLLAMPIGVFLAFYMNMQAKGLWIGLIIGLTITAILGTRKFWRLTALREK